MLPILVVFLFRGILKQVSLLGINISVAIANAERRAPMAGKVVSVDIPVAQLARQNDARSWLI
jgi:hypothetical protein